jgi:hypothetical protein
MDKLESTIGDDLQFFKLFKDGTRATLQNDEEGYVPKESLNQGTNLLMEMQNKPHTFVIHAGQRQFQFHFRLSDPIFKLEGPAGTPALAESTIVLTDACNCCQDHLKSTKDTKHCQFCALTYCGKCLYKKRKFAADPSQKGEVCKVCDNKFFIRDMLQSKFTDIDKNMRLIGGDPLSRETSKQLGLQQQIEKAQQDLQRLQKQQKKIKKIY